MKTNPVPKLMFIAALAALLASFRAEAADNLVDTIELLRTTYKVDRQAVVAENLQLTESESPGFWPLYRSYRADMEKLGDSLLKLVLEYADVYPNVPEERARQLLKEYLAAEEKFVNKRAWYFKRAARSLPAAKALRWVQLENRMDLVLRLQLAGSVPLVPAAPTKP
jgi:hypothetical protein